MVASRTLCFAVAVVEAVVAVAVVVTLSEAEAIARVLALGLVVATRRAVTLPLRHPTVASRVSSTAGVSR